MFSVQLRVGRWRLLLVASFSRIRPFNKTTSEVPGDGGGHSNAMSSLNYRAAIGSMQQSSQREINNPGAGTARNYPIDILNRQINMVQNANFVHQCAPANSYQSKIKRG